MASRVTAPDYRSDYLGRRAVRWVGRRIGGNAVRNILKYGGSLAAAGYTLNKLDDHFHFIESGNQRLRNAAICLVGAYVAGMLVLRGLAPAILKLAGKASKIIVPPSIRDIRLLGRAFRKLSRDLSDLSQFRTDLMMAASQTPALAVTANTLNTALAANNFGQARGILRSITPQMLEDHNQAVAGDLTRESYGLDAKLFARALYLATLRSASITMAQDLNARNYANVLATLDESLRILDSKEVKGALGFKENVRELIGRATEAAFGLSQQPATPAAPPAVPTPGASLPPALSGPGAGTP